LLLRKREFLQHQNQDKSYKVKHSLGMTKPVFPTFIPASLKRHQNHLQQQNQYFFTLALFAPCVPFGLF
jgi:hypothetical protein